MIKVLVSDDLSEQGVEVFRNAQGIEVDVKIGLKPDELKAIIGNYDGYSSAVRSATKVTKEIIEASTRLKVVGRAGSRTDNIDKEAATKGVVVMNTPGGNTVTTAEHALAMLMALVRRFLRPPLPCVPKNGKKRNLWAQKFTIKPWVLSEWEKSEVWLRIAPEV